jgi:hypothetical protein
LFVAAQTTPPSVQTLENDDPVFSMPGNQAQAETQTESAVTMRGRDRAAGVILAQQGCTILRLV